jgi:ureidoglycolate lyase
VKLLRYGPAGRERPGLLDAKGRIRSLAEHLPDLAGDALAPAALDRLRALDPAGLPLVDAGVRIGPCVAGVGKFLCIGLNYADHAAESGMEVPAEPVVFSKATSAICGPDDDIVIPPRRGEGRLGGRARRRDRQRRQARAGGARARARRRLLRDQRPLRAPLPARARRTVGQGQELRLVRADRAVARHARRGARPAALAPVARGRRSSLPGRQHAHDGLRRRAPGFLPVAVHEPAPRRRHLDGHPPGVGLGQKPPLYLRAGQSVRLSIEGMGVQTQRTVDEA